MSKQNVKINICEYIFIKGLNFETKISRNLENLEPKNVKDFSVFEVTDNKAIGRISKLRTVKDLFELIKNKNFSEEDYE